MKTIFFIRHAKSSWSDMNAADIDRTLNNRGLRDAPFMAKLLRGKGNKIDQFISSPATRAFSTAQFFAAEFGVAKDDIQIEKFIYHSYAPEILFFVKKLDDALDTVCIFGHNPTMTSIANSFSEEYIVNVPTCGILKVESNSKTWTEFTEDNAKLTDFYFPKQYFE